MFLSNLFFFFKHITNESKTIQNAYVFILHSSILLIYIEKKTHKILQILLALNIIPINGYIASFKF